ncbi:MAG: hypothetical protein ACE5I5_14040 [Candidatus Heimdallarchaeota archaeon]
MSQKDIRIDEITSAIKHETRRTILTMLSDRSPMRYSDLMVALGLEPRDDSGSFGYHIKILTDNGLIIQSEKGYSLSELGKRVFGLLTAIDHEDRDKYGVITTIQSLTTKDEVNLLLAQFGWIFALLLIFISLIGFFTKDEPSPLHILMVFLSLTVVVLVSTASIKTISSVRPKLPKGLSKLFFLNTEWVYASPNRNYLIAALLAYMGAYITGALAFISFIDRIPVSPLILTLITVLFTLLCGLALNHVRKKDQLSELSS